MRDVHSALALSLALSAGLGAGRAPSGPTLHEATFNKDAAPILFAKCVGCHRAGQMAPMALMTYRDVRPWVHAIKKKVLSREMPPWRADPRFGRFRNDRSLTQQEIDTLVAWVDAGAHEGTGPPPTVPPFAEGGWSHPSGRPPDIVMDMPIEFTVPAEGQLPPFAVYSELPSGLAGSDHFVQAVQLLPSNPAVVHHSTFSMRALPAGVKLGSGPAWPGGPTVSHIPVLVDRSPAGLAARRASSAAEAFSTVGASHFLFYFPGNNGFAQFAPGAGKRIRHQDFAEWSVHYTPSGRRETDRERVGLWLQREPPTHEVLTMRIGDFHIVNGQEVVLPSGIDTTPGHAAIVSVVSRCGDVPCLEDRSMIPRIPPLAENWKITGITPFQDDVTLYLAYPHGHLRLTDMTYVVTYPDGREETILSVPRFDFNWQIVYEWAQPLRVPAGSTIKAIAHYDNSRNNRSNPAPETAVLWGEQTSDEMFNGYVDLSIDKMDVRLERSPDFGAVDVSLPKAPIVTVVGCVGRDAGTEVLTRASAPRRSAIVHADAREIAEAREIPLGSSRYRLIGTADFASTDDLLSSGQRAMFTREAMANATRSLQNGRKVAVKALLVPDTPEPTLNLLSVQPISESCK